MDHRSIRLMEDLPVDGLNTTSDVVKNNGQRKPTSSSSFNKLKVEMQTLQISEESERQLYDTLKHIYGANFKLSDASEFENKKSNLNNQYWMERGNLVVKGIVDYSSKDTTPKSEEQITREFATSKLESYGFHASHCIEALMHTDGDLGRALEILFYKYYGIKEISRNTDYENIDEADLLEQLCEEKEIMESIYGNAFHEKIKNRIWTVQLKLNYLTNNEETEEVAVKEKKQEKQKEICRLFMRNKCRFGDKCRFLHQLPKKVSNAPVQEDPYFTLEIRFPEGCKYPYEAPYFYIYKNDRMFPRINCLRIARKLHDHALSLAEQGTPSLFSIISFLEYEFGVKTYLEENREQFLDQYEPLFPKEQENEEEESAASHYKLGSTNKKNRDCVSWEEIIKEDDLLEKRFKEKQKNANYRKMKETRKKLPVWSNMTKILETVQQNQVVIISGETGCGKSTQVPQFILDDWIINRSQSGDKPHVNIVCTQPRRISAIGVAERVAAERDENIGGTVGYQIRLESKMSGKTRLTFCTTGILLQRLSASFELPDVTHVIVDEVHERSAESDLLLMLLKELLLKRPAMKVILMSATLKADTFSSYFEQAPVLNIPGLTFPVEQIFLEDALERIGYVVEENSKFTRTIKGGWDQLAIDLEVADIEGLPASSPKESIQDENLTLKQLVTRYHGYSRQTYKNLYVMDHKRINFELIERILEWIVFGEHDYPRTGSILVFLPGFAEILTLKDQLYDNKNLSPRTKQFVIVPLHSSLSNEEQSLVFQKTKSGVRKIVLSTNMAETSITIDDCVFVIDTGMMKENRFNSGLNMESLDTCWVSRANAMQRKGRAGRVMPGVCIHLYTSYRFKYHFSGQPVPEILRISLEPLLLRIRFMHKAKKIDLHKMFERMLEPPTHESITNSIKRLQDVGAFDSRCMLTPLGHHLAALPVNAKIGKLILFGAIFCCLDSALTIAACLSYKNPFYVPFEKRHEVDPKQEFFVANSDQLTVLKAYKKWLAVRSRSAQAAQVFASLNYLSVQTFHTLADIKYQFLELLVSIGFAPVNLPKRRPNFDNIFEITGPELNVNNENYKLLQGLLCAALYPNVVKVFTPAKSFQVQSAGAVPILPKPEELRFQTKDDCYVYIHPSSVNFRTGHYTSPYLVYQEKIKTSRVYIKEVSMIPSLPLLLFSGYQLNMELHNGTFVLSLEDGWIMFVVESHRMGQLLQRIRIELAKLLEQKMQDPLLNLLNHQEGKQIIRTIVNVITKA
ncbi:PREDICTED: putative ATP-dependent RNA helicase DHX57 isoform X1 [Dinoponera quadriceps]|uniref:Putative ATP-dependent RNA helicase DHX57 n=2 Tax=Dinoponera quadriceps TaxID=609295 RepID=A0A6P3Y635_DINQU|nr:PREDICTED: putative ATP-dependent RNA helicase DHX57 isoform X1 [Dinoponera quadriceps]